MTALMLAEGSVGFATLALIIAVGVLVFVLLRRR